ncbi:hypothetical protein PIB30_065843 [Stylosanthes scabra]|uniref:Uncharacterized protein n=1 Tax=Stylosanthes scabra TaxID=79078 RepID=A0ABU6TN36_9FABA|nr:hypothetical protein [Stylosanthes scabra]
MRGTLTLYTLTLICPNPSHILSPITHACAYNLTHMRDPHIPHLITLTPCPNNSTHMRGSLNPAQRLAAHIGHCLRTSTDSSLVRETSSISIKALTMASSSSGSVFDNHRFKSAFNEELYNTIVKNKEVIAECCINLDEDEYSEIREQIALRGWRRLSAPKQEISIDLIH